MDEGSASSSTSTVSDILPMTPISESPPSSDLVPDSTPTMEPNPERKLTIRVPMEYIPPSPPPSASLPAIPASSRPQSLTPVATTIPQQQQQQAKRASVPIWVAAAVEHRPSTPPPEPTSPSTTVEAENGAKTETPAATAAEACETHIKMPSKTIIMTSSHSAVHLPSAHPSSQPQQRNDNSNSAAKFGTTLLPTSIPATTRPRRKSAPGQRNTSFELDGMVPDLPRMRKSPSFIPHVSHIDFDSSSSESEDEVDRVPDKGQSAGGGSRRRLFSEESDLSRWAPEPAMTLNTTLASTSQSSSPRKQWSTRSAQSRSSASASHSLRSKDSGVLGMGMSASEFRARPTTPVRLGAHSNLSNINGNTDNTMMMGMPKEFVQRDVDYTMRALMSREMFVRMLGEPLARQRFREFLAADGSAAALDFWTDAQWLAQAAGRVRAAGVAFRDLYVSNSGDSHVTLAPEVRRELLAALQHIVASDASFGSTQTQLLDGMYQDQFQRFIKHQIIQETHVSLEKSNLAAQELSEGLGDTFVLTNPRLPDHPIVLVSDGFVDVTGYPRALIVGRNCRFLQGPGTPPASVQRIRDGLNSGKGCTELLLNYRRNGEPFYCLLCIIPVRDTSGTIVYFIGGQTNVTGLLATDQGIGMHGAGGGRGSDGGVPSATLTQMSPALAMRLEHPRQTAHRSSTADLLAGPTGSQRRGAAGATESRQSQALNGHTSHGGSGFFRGLFGRGGQAAAGGLGVKPEGKQVIAGAEAMMNLPGARGLQDQYALFQNTYNKVIVFKFKKREITFVSPQMLAFLGLPTRTQRDLHASSLIRNDMVRLVTAGDDRNETRRLREDLKDNVQRGTPCSLYCAVKVPGKGLLPRTIDNSRHKFGMMHMTPIKDGDNVAVAFVAIFG
ncbi:hypothetical protein R3P38DRAFT_1322325 [Favolaschia claudopus]|uniref:RGS domain-containing protein n=1 Tax=Favolaschia claudopus TaxID=2862362 RepID=A0AAW0AX84_9AGAR